MVSTVCCLQLKLLAIACWKQRESTSCNVDVECAATLKVNFPTSSKFQLTLPPTILFRQSSSQTLMSDLQWSETKGNLNSKYDDAWKKSRSLSLSKDHSEHSQPQSTVSMYIRTISSQCLLSTLINQFMGLMGTHRLDRQI